MRQLPLLKVLAVTTLVFSPLCYSSGDHNSLVRHVMPNLIVSEPNLIARSSGEVKSYPVDPGCPFLDPDMCQGE